MAQFLFLSWLLVAVSAANGFTVQENLSRRSSSSSSSSSSASGAALLNANTCGVNKYGSGGDKIVGGHEARKHQFPWLVSLWAEYPEWGVDNHMCGGTLISPQYIVTAVHCTVEVGDAVFETPKVWKALIGAHDFNNLDSSAKWVKIERIVNNKFSSLTHENDIAIWKLAEPVEIDTEDWVSNTLCLPPEDQELDLTKLKCRVAGFGLLTQDGIPATVLQEVELPVISTEKCRTYYPKKVWYPQQIFDSNFCAGLEEGGKDSCQGDSGGPFMCINPNTGRYFLAGIVSWGNGCPNAGRPGVLIDPKHYLPWIRETIQNLEA